MSIKAVKYVEGKLYAPKRKTNYPCYINLHVPAGLRAELNKLHKKKVVVTITHIIESKPKKIKLMVEK